MNLKDFNKVKDLFQSALELETAEREQFLAKNCPDELRAEVESLLESFEKSESFIENPAAKINEVFASENSDGKLIGSYKIIKEIGKGGMGIVYLASREDEQFHQRVAIKVVKREIDNEEVLHRFRNERQILASLKHPNIAQLLDGGTTNEGSPYFVMEYVEGLPLTQYCDEKQLSANERLDLFKKICSAVQHAHQNLIIHRDLKPNNIIVTHKGEPKLLDFGIAKFLNPELSGEMSQTMTQFRVMTPEYASPEQIKGSHITTASDIYSLGVILYELLTGERPYKLEGKNLEEVFQTITQFEPNLPSKVISNSGSTKIPQSAIRNAQSLKGDLDNIVLMALRKEPIRRYKSVEQFADDIQRYLKGLPVSARPNTFSYRAEKFIKRNLAACAVGSLLVLSLFGGLFISLRQTNIAYASQAKAESETAKSQKIAKFMEKVLNYANPAWYAEGSKKLGEAKLIDVIEDLSDKIPTEFPDDLDIQAELHHKFAEIYQAKSNKIKSLFHAEKALELRRRVYGEKHAEVAKDLFYLSAAKFVNGNVIESVSLGDKAIQMFHEIAPDNANLPYLLEDNGGRYFEHYSDSEKAEKYFTEALEIFRKKDGENHYNTARMFMNLSKVYAKKGDLAKSDEFYREGEKRFKLLPDENLRQFFIIQQGEVLLAKGDFEGFENLLENRLSELTKNGEGESPFALKIRNDLGNYYGQNERHEKYIEQIKFSLSLETRKPFPDKDYIGSGKANLAYCLLRLGKEAEAKPYFEEAFQQFKQSPDKNPWLYESTIARCLFYLKRYQEAEPYLQHSLNEFKANVPPMKEHKELAEMLDKIKANLKQ